MTHVSLGTQKALADFAHRDEVVVRHQALYLGHFLLKQLGRGEKGLINRLHLMYLSDRY